MTIQVRPAEGNNTIAIDRVEGGKAYGKLGISSAPQHKTVWDTTTGYALEVQQTLISEKMSRANPSFAGTVWAIHPDDLNKLLPVDWTKPIRVKGDNRPAEVVTTDYILDGDRLVAVRLTSPESSKGLLLRTQDNQFVENPDISVPGRGSAIVLENVPETSTVSLRVDPDGSQSTTFKPNLTLTFEGDKLVKADVLPS